MSKRTQKSASIELPPPDFSNAMCDIDPTFNFQNWRQSREWRIFVAGYNAAVKVSNRAVLAQYNMGQVAEKVFGKGHQ